MNKLNKKQQQKNEAFYIKKRSLVRKAQQIIKHCESDVLIVIHKHDTDRVFSFSSSEQFDLAKVAKLVRKDVSERVQVKKQERFVIQDFSKVEKRIHDIQTLLENQDYGSNTSTDNDTKDKTAFHMDTKMMNESIMQSKALELMEDQSPYKTEYKRCDVITGDVSINEFDGESSQRDQQQLSQLIYSSHKCESFKKPFLHKTPTPAVVAPLTMNFDLSKVDEDSKADKSSLSPRFESLTPRQMQSQFGRQQSVPLGELRPLTLNLPKIKEAQDDDDVAISTPKSNAQFKNAQNSPLKQLQPSNWMPYQFGNNCAQPQMREVEQKLHADQTQHFQQPQTNVQNTENYPIQNTNGNLFSVDSFYNEPILNCDDIVWYNNWDDVRQD